MKKTLLTTSCIVSLSFGAAPAFAQTPAPQTSAEADVLDQALPLQLRHLLL